MFRRRPRPLRALLVLFAGAVLLCLPFAAAKDEENLGFFLDWRPELEPLLLIAFVAVLSLMGRRLPAFVRWLVALLVFLAALVQFAEAMVWGALDRELDLYFDLPHVPKLLSLVYEAAGPWRGALAFLGLSLAAFALVAAIALLLGAIERALAPPRHAALCVGLFLAAPLATLGAGALSDNEPFVGLRTAPALFSQIAHVYRAFAVTHGFDHRYDAMLAAPQPKPSPLPGLKGRDVILVFVESYGTVALDDPRYAASVGPALAEFAATVEQAGYHLRSGRILSPTFGGGSWLAHGTIDSGLRLDPLLTRLVLDSGRATLARYLHSAGYRAVEVMPGLKTPEPEHDFWGFERSYYDADLGYGGPAFGWFDIPDQYTLRRFEATEGASGHAPLFAQIVLVSSHTPFVPVPPYVGDWNDAGDYKTVTPAEWERIYAPPDWAHLEDAYAESVVYDLKTLGAWLAHREGDALVFILGDHQPPGFVSGEKQPWTVPIHVLSRDADLVGRFAAQGYVAAALPPRDGSIKGMESFLGDFLSAFAAAPPVVATHPESAEPPAE
ncbi:MAG TPA: hypothetical protein VGU20_16625 [Stellaceae bacterium]|nr:hypothetical protein [Stellaceae bacterium]